MQSTVPYISAFLLVAGDHEYGRIVAADDYRQAWKTLKAAIRNNKKHPGELRSQLNECFFGKSNKKFGKSPIMSRMEPYALGNVIKNLFSEC